LQYISTGNLAGGNRVALIAMNYLHQRRLKIYGHARIVTAEEDPVMVETFADPAYDAVVERVVLVDVEAFDWNCPQHITARFTVQELDTHLAPLRDQLAALHAENTRLRDELSRRPPEGLPGG
jgi:predicted pyridoxine 5'-phosphate oxidase superfamily flavin-nucleotide-binding protein